MFRDRDDAGRQLAALLTDEAIDRPVVLALPRGVFRWRRTWPRCSARHWRRWWRGRSVRARSTRAGYRRHRGRPRRGRRDPHRRPAGTGQPPDEDARRARTGRVVRTALGHRAIGVVYNPDRERRGNYVSSILGRRYDALIYCDRTGAVTPLQPTETNMREPE